MKPIGLEPLVTEADVGVFRPTELCCAVFYTRKIFCSEKKNVFNFEKKYQAV